VVASSKCKLWVMERDVYNHIYREDVQRVTREKQDLVAGLPIFQVLSDDLRSVLCDALVQVEFEANRVVFYKGDEGNSFYLIKSGNVNITSGEKVRGQGEGLGRERRVRLVRRVGHLLWGRDASFISWNRPRCFLCQLLHLWSTRRTATEERT